MRVLKIILIVLLVLFVLAIVGGIIFIKTFDINRYKPQIIAAAQSSLGRSVNMGTMDLQASLKEGVRLDVHEVTIGEHPSYGSGDFLKIDEAYIGIDVLAYLLKKQISISKLSIKAPSVNIIIAADGSLNAQTIGKQPSETTYPVPEEEPNANTTTPAQSAPAKSAPLPDIFISLLEVTGGTVTITDQSQTPPLTLAVKNLAVGLNGFSLNAPFSFTAAAAVFGDAQNLQVEGRAQVNPQTSEVKLSHLKTTVDLTSLPLAEIRKLPYIPANVPFPRELAGNLAVTVKDLSAGAKGLQSILMDAALANGTVAIDNVAPGVSVAASQINFGLTNFSLSDTPFQWNLSAAYLNKTPNIAGQGTASFNMLTQAVTLKDTSFKTDLALIPLAELKSALPQLKDVPLPDKLAGQLSLVIKDFAGSAKGVEALKADVNLTGGEVSMKDAAPGVSVAAKAIDATITNLSLNEPFTFNIKAAYLNDLPNIALEGKGSFNMGNQSVRLSDTKFTTDLAKISFAQLKESVASLKDVPLPDEAAGIMTIAITDAIAGPQGLERLMADANLSEGKIVMKEVSPGVSFNASQIQFALKNFSISQEPFSFNGKLATYSDLPNIAFEGKGLFDMKTQQVTINDLNVNSDLSSFSLEALRQSMASLKDAPLPQSIKGKFKIAIPTLATGPQGLSGIKGVIALSDGAITLKELPTPVEDVDAQILMSNEAIELPKVTLNIGQGRLSVQGKMTEPLTATPSVNFMTTIGSLNIAQLMDQSKSDVKVEGFISGDLQIEGEKIDPKQFMNFLKGGGRFKIEKGKLTDINILRMVLDKLEFIPNLRQTVEENLPERFKKKLEQKDTILTAVTMDLGIDSGNFFVQPLNVEADGFLFEGNGRAAMDQSYSFDGAFIIPEDLAAAMAQAVPEFELLFDELNQIRFPLKVSGQGSKVSFSPDTNYIMTNVLKNKGKQELQKVLNKVFDVKEENPEESPEGQPQKKPASDGSQNGTNSQQQKRPEEILIEGVLDSIFK